jgi:RHS repeat-associated protein
MVCLVAGPTNQHLVFEYDWRGRRIRKTVKKSDNSIITDTKYLYDGWNLIAELNATNNNVIRSYVWGLDLSGSLQGAGGVGGLLAVNYYDTQKTNRCFVAYDGNGNVAALINPTNGLVCARYEYGPFGELIRATGPMAKTNPFRFSTKYQDDETDLVYYGYRYYNASTGRWLSRDPIAERGGLNLYGFVFNNPVNKADAFGLICTEALGKNGESRIVFTQSESQGGGWSGGTATFGDPAGGGSLQEFTTVSVDYTAQVTVMCKCNNCYHLKNGVRVYHQETDGDWTHYKPGNLPLGVELPVVTGVMQGLGKLGAKWIERVIGAWIMDELDTNDALKAIAALPHPTSPNDGDWKNGKSPCAE